MKDNAIHRAMRLTLQEILLSFCSFRYIIFYYIYGKMNEINISLFCNFVSYICYNFCKKTAEKMFGMFDNASICWSNVDAENIATISPLQ